jgi:toxin ParE1/3/4
VPQIRHTARARRDLVEIWIDIASANPSAANRLFDRLEARVKILEVFQEAGPLRPEIDPAARMLIEPPYLILYRLIPDGAQIVRILHGARNIGPALFREGIENP